MALGTGYIVEYKDNINVGQAKILVKGIGNYTGEKIIEFNIIQADICTLEVANIENQAYTGSNIMPKVKATYNSINLIEGIDYKLSYKNNKKLGTAKVIIQGIGNYTGTKEVYFKILKNIDSAKVSGVESKTYTGSKQTQSITVKDGSKKLKNGTDYTVAYSNNVNAGTATITITGKGSYAGTKKITFKISKRSITNLSFSNVKSYTYTGKAIIPSITIKYGKITLAKDTDYELSYSKNKNAGTATITITGKGSYTGTKKITFKINKRSISSSEISGLKSKIYTGSKQKQSLILKYNGITLKNGTDYTLSYKSNTSAGKATVTITGKGNFTGSKSLTFKIKARDINELEITSSTSARYTGSAITPSITVKYGKSTLKNKVDYTVTYKNNTKVGTATITVTGKGNYTGSKIITFKIKQRSITSATVKGLESKTYTGGKLTPSLKLTYKGKTLKNGTDYTLTYENNINVGTAKVIITGKGNFIGTETLTFKIKRRSIEKLSFSKVSNYTYTGKAITPNVTIKYGKITLTKGEDYELTYSKNKNAGTATITITGKGSYTGTKKIIFKIKKRNISAATVTGLKSKVYTGYSQTQSLTVVYNNMTLKNATDYTLTYTNNVRIGTATVTIKGKGNYTGEQKLKFNIENAKYYIKVNNKANVVTIYEKGTSGKYDVPVKAMICSTGTYTPKSGKYTIASRWKWLKLYGGVYGHYTTQITGDILFHSVPYLEKSADTLKYWEYDKLGTAASLGCVRLTAEDAKWIYDNVSRGTTVEFYSSSNPGPLGKPEAMKISDYKEYRDWDPTDPSSKNPWKEIL